MEKILETILSGEKIQSLIESLPEKGPFGEEVERRVEDFGIVSRSITADGVSPKAELHENYTDIFLVQEGEEELFIGGKITDKVSTGPGEWRGPTLVKARKYQVKAGDVVIIPKGVAHRHGKGVIKMIVIKIG